MAWPSKEEMQKMLLTKKTEILAQQFGLSRVTFMSKIKKMGLSSQPRGFFLRKENKSP
jgi:hypothetical protein